MERNTVSVTIAPRGHSYKVRGEIQRAREFAAASSVESTEKAMQYFTGTDRGTGQETHCCQGKANNGIFAYDDPLNGDHLKLTYDDIDFTRTSTIWLLSGRKIPRLDGASEINVIIGELEVVAV